MHILILSTSPNKAGNTLKLGKAIKSILATTPHTASLIDFSESDIPLPNQGNFDLNEPTPFQSRLIEEMQAAKLIFLFTPEYNWMPSPEALNFINRFASGATLPLFEKKVFALAGVSAGRGGRMPAVQMAMALNKIIGFFGLFSVVSGKIFEAQEVPKVISDEGELLQNEAFNKGIHAFVDYHLQFCEQW
jgi:chromate reductase